ncbi:spindle assembly abnormal protein 6 [Biomphalaria glabrata]|nr:putative spindle assembly abnormal protein 6 [Biomphalaria glabrata]
MDDIFSKRIPLSFKALDKEERKVLVNLHMRIERSKHDSKKELIVKLTDDQDLFFLYTLRLTEEDFHSLKLQQGLLVDFIAFPQKLIDLLEMCIKENSKDNPKFIIQFVSMDSCGLGGISPCLMNIVETNPFRHLNHLSLKFVPGSDADIKSHLASCLKQLKETNNLLQHKLEHTSQDLSSKLQSTEELLSAKSSELESLKLEWSSRIADITSKHKEDMALEKEKTIQFQSNIQVRYDRERREMEQAHAKLVKQLETRLEEVEILNKDLTDKRYKSEATIREYKAKCAALEEECTHFKSEVHTLRKENSSLESARLEKEKVNNQLLTRVAVIEQELKDKGELLEKSNDLLSSEKDKKKHLESELDSRQREINKLEAKVKAMGEELKKGNEIIKKLQGEIKTYHAKVKVRTQIATEQEKVIGEKESELESVRKDLASVKNKLQETEDKNQKLSSDLESATQKLEESRKLLKTNENMIQWLHKQINEQQNQLVQTVPMQSRAIHNHSTSSHGSTMSQDIGRYQRPPLSSTQHNHQVDYQSLPTTKVASSGIPVALPTRRSGSNLPVSGNQENVNLLGGDRDRNPPLDPKFLMKRDEAIPVRGILHQHSNASKTHSPTSETNTMMASYTNTNMRLHNVPPLASAYFPVCSWPSSIFRAMQHLQGHAACSGPRRQQTKVRSTTRSRQTEPKLKHSRYSGHWSRLRFTKAYHWSEKIARCPPATKLLLTNVCATVLDRYVDMRCRAKCPVSTNTTEGKRAQFYKL